METILVRSGIVIYSVVVLFLTALLWRNTAAPDALKNTGILWSSILPVIIAVLPYINKPEPLEKRFVYALLYDSVTKNITTGEEFNAYFGKYIQMFSNTSLVPDALHAESFSEVMETKGLNIIEKGIIDALSMKFMSHWDITETILRGPAFLSAERTSDSRQKMSKFNIGELQKIFKHNPLISTSGVIVIPCLVLPPESQITTGQNSQTKMRTITISNPYAATTISIQATIGGLIQQGVYGVLQSDPTNMNRYSAVHFKVSISTIFDRTKMYSPEMVLYRRWHENVVGTLSQFDWENIEKDVDHTMLIKAVSKILEK